jgi:hypothetical protein
MCLMFVAVGITRFYFFLGTGNGSGSGRASNHRAAEGDNGQIRPCVCVFFDAGD